MSLKIYENQGAFELHGQVSTYNAIQVKKYFEIILKMRSRVVINLNFLENMDVVGVYELRNLLVHATEAGRYLTIEGANNPNIKDAFIDSGCNLSYFNYFQLSA